MKKQIKPILFNTPMTQAILEGRKTQTRRIIRGFIPEDACFGFDFFTRERGKNEIACRGTFGENYGERFIKLPYLPGDVLYVRETWAQPYGKGFYYAAEYREHDILEADNGNVSVSKNMVKWRPSIHMPKAAARIFLHVKKVGVERLQSISGENCISEGCDPEMLEVSEEFAKGYFSGIWDDTIKKDDLSKFGWCANPWVWVISFERITREEAQNADVQ